MSLTQPGVTTVMDEALSDVPSDVKQPQHALVCVAPGQFATDYMKWFYMISYPFMSPTQPGVTTVMDEALSDVPSDVKQPQHALV